MEEQRTERSTRDIDRPVPRVDDGEVDGPSGEIAAPATFTVREREPPVEGEVVSPGGMCRNLALERRMLDLLDGDLHRAVRKMEFTLSERGTRGSFYCTGYANGEPI